MLKICITADYELFLSNNYFSEREVLIYPAQKLIDVCTNHGVPVTLFADVCSLMTYRQYNLNDFPDCAEEQLKSAVSNGHDVQLHIHPQWINAEYDGKCLVLNDSYYRIHELENDDKRNDINMYSVILSTKKYLEDLFVAVDPKYRCVAFRAGGWCIQPEKDLFRELIRNGICIDSSIINGFYSGKNKKQYYDFRNLPKCINWWIDPSLGLIKENPFQKGIYEVPVGSYLGIYSSIINFYCAVARRIKRIERNKPRGKPSIDPLSIEERIKNLITAPLILNFDIIDSNSMIEVCMNYYIKRSKRIQKDIYIATVCHPKNLYDKNIEYINAFIKKYQNSKDISFTSYNDIYREILQEE